VNTDTRQTEWIKASASGDQGQCAQLRRAADGMIELGDDKDPGGPILRFTTDEMKALFDGVTNGEFDHLLA
jgi:hypothetical protein